MNSYGLPSPLFFLFFFVTLVSLGAGILCLLAVKEPVLRTRLRVRGWAFLSAGLIGLFAMILGVRL